VTKDGGVIAWGCVEDPEFPTLGGVREPCEVPASAESGGKAVAAGTAHSLALTQDGRVVAWGCGSIWDFGQCDVPVSAESGVSAIDAGGSHSLALTKRGRVLAWGCPSTAPGSATSLPRPSAG
jgi:alpha-tubulin suppressor-like RCC1 family protein